MFERLTIYVEIYIQLFYVSPRASVHAHLILFIIMEPAKEANCYLRVDLIKPASMSVRPQTVSPIGNEIWCVGRGR